MSPFWISIWARARLASWIMLKPGTHTTPCALGDGLHLLDLGHGGGQRLFDQHVLAGFHRQPGVLQVRVQVGQHEHGVDLGVGDQVFGRLVALAAVPRGALDRAFDGVRFHRPTSFAPGICLDRLGVQDRDLARADEADANRFETWDAPCDMMPPTLSRLPHRSSEGLGSPGALRPIRHAALTRGGGGGRSRW